MPIEL
jgi:hypothetical protein